MVGNQARILLQGLQAVLELVTQLPVLRAFLDRFDQRLRYMAVLLYLRLEAGNDRADILGRHLSTLQAADESLIVGLAMLQRVDEKAEDRQLLGQHLEVSLCRNITATGEGVDSIGTSLNGIDCPEVAKHGQRAGDLLQRRIEQPEVLALFRVAEEGIERLLDLGEVGLDLACDLTDEELLLGPPRHLIEKRQLFRAAQRTAGDACMQACDHQIDLLREICAEAVEILLRILQQQNGRRHFHGHAVRMALWILGQPCREGRKALTKALEVGMADLVR